MSKEGRLCSALQCTSPQLGRSPSECRTPGTLPEQKGNRLGRRAAFEFAGASFLLRPGDRLTFVSDGVLEATNACRELFGFDRLREISSEEAGQIADAAGQFGQEDDITVPTLQCHPAPAQTGTGLADQARWLDDSRKNRSSASARVLSCRLLRLLRSNVRRYQSIFRAALAVCRGERKCRFREPWPFRHSGLQFETAWSRYSH